METGSTDQVTAIERNRWEHTVNHTGEPPAIVILNWNNSPDTNATIQAIQDWKRLPPVIWVVDNGSQDDSVERIQRECPGVRLSLNDHNRGFVAGNNLNR